MAEILIKGMEMPTKVNHPLFIRISSDGHIAKGDSLKGGFIETEAKAVTLPELHGRLGDLDFLEGLLDEVNSYGAASEITYKKMIEILHDETLTPTIIEASE